MKIFKLLLIFTCLITINKVKAQNIPSKLHLGTVAYIKQSKVIDTAAFKKSSSIFIKNMIDSVKSQAIAVKTTLKEDTSGINDMTAAFETLIFQEIFKTELTEKYIDELQKDKIANFIIETEGNKRERFNFNYADHLVYNSYNSEEIENYFDSEEITSLKEYKTERKVIKGYNCFKIVYIYREKFDNEEFHMPKMIMERELWVTDKIIVPFHSIVRSPEILSKYYPIEITEKMKGVNGFETSYVIENISIK